MVRFPCLEFVQAERLQQQLVEQRIGGLIDDHLLLLEHPPVYTLGRSASLDHLRSQPQIPVRRTTRGGEITYHGPGQLVAYPILQLEATRRDLHAYLRDLEQVILDCCADLGVQARRWPGRTGCWVGDCKLASIGVRASRWVTSHGVALNYGPELEGFRGIVPCGLAGVEMTSLSQLLGVNVERSMLEQRFCQHFFRIFNRTMLEQI